jgi:hypothetical protein
LRDAFVRCDGEVQLARALLHDALAAPSTLSTLGFDGPAAAEARADAAADAMATTPAAAPLFTDAGCQELYPRIVASHWLAAAADAPEDGHLDAHGLRALWLEASSMASKGVVHDRREGGKRYLEVDRAQFAQAAGELVRLFDELEKSGNAARVAELFEQQGARVDLATRDEMNERLHAIARHVALVPPRIVPVLEDQRVTDAHAVPIGDLDEEVLRALQAL